MRTFRCNCGVTKSVTDRVTAVSYTHLTLEEAAAYSGIGINKLRSLSDNEHCQFVLWVGSKRLIKRRKLDEYTERMYSL